MLPSGSRSRRGSRIGARNNNDAHTFAQRHPDTISDAQAAGLLTYSTSDDGQPIDLKLSPDVAFSLEIDVNLHDALLLDPPEKPGDLHH